jgi:hypothetical protein
MLVKDLAVMLRALAQDADLHSSTEAAAGFRACADALGRQRAKLTVHEALAFWRGCSRSDVKTDLVRAHPMSARKVAAHLQVVADAAKPVARKQALGPLSSFIAFLHERGDEEAEALVAPKVPKAPTRDWARLLQSAGTDRKRFDSLIAELSADQTTKLEDMNQITAGYTGSSRKARSRKEALERIRDHFEIDAQYEAKAASIDKLTGSDR